MKLGREEEKGRVDDFIHAAWLQGESSISSRQIFLTRNSASATSFLAVISLEEHVTSFPTLSSVLI